MIIVPAVYPEIFEEIVDKLYLIGDLSKLVQINFCDGSYGLRVSWLPKGKEILPETHDYEVDLILTSWKEYIEKVNKLGIRRVIIHIDEFNDSDYEELFNFVYLKHLTLGLTISNDVSIDVLVNAIKKAKESKMGNFMNRVFAQVTCLKNLEQDNHPFDERSESRIKVLKQMFPDLMVQASGRINPETVKIVKRAGADRIVVGSYIFGHDDLKEAIEILKKAIEEDLKEEVKEVVVKKEEETEVEVPKKETVKKEEEIEKEEVVKNKKYVLPENEIKDGYKASDDEIVYL